MNVPFMSGKFWALSLEAYFSHPKKNLQSKPFCLGKENGTLITAEEWPYWYWTSSHYAITYQKYMNTVCYTCQRTVHSDPIWHLYRVNLLGQRFDVHIFCQHCKDMYFSGLFDKEEGAEAYVNKWLSPIHELIEENEKLLQDAFPVPWKLLYQKLVNYQQHLLKQEVTSLTAADWDVLRPTKNTLILPACNQRIAKILREWQSNQTLTKKFNGKIALKTIRTKLNEAYGYTIGQRDQSFENTLCHVLGVTIAEYLNFRAGRLRGIRGWTFYDQPDK
jgi:hypothetical protein